MPIEDPEERVAELERQLAEARAAARRSPFRDAEVPPFDYPGQDRSSSLYEVALAPAPRRVPLRFLLAEALPFRWWYLFAMFIVAIPPIIVWFMQPRLVLPAAVLVLLLIYGFHLRGVVTRLALLKWGQVATVTGTEVLSQGTYYGGTTYSNVVLPVARGWTVARPIWSGPKTKTRIRYALGRQLGEITVGGREYVDGVILADQRNPQRALCVTSFPYDLDRDDAGNWSGRLRVRLQIGMVCWLLVMVGWVGGTALLFHSYRSYLESLPVSSDPTGSPQAPTVSAQPGDEVIINGTNETRSIACNGNDVVVNGSAEHVNITGHCLSLTVSGSGNHVSADVVDAITTNGMNNVVTFRAGSPRITAGGVGNVVEPG
ncbi:DUF3060 domain-containing protein [Mycolicibacterium tusciae]|uniref:DUF3060 domain-containing protein n=1 Tax=Mycolicibacterium tusciae TaxID=75922 RepID=UPI00024A1EA7|nr:DUF3060 domain-containing protein [Mycolicibacterium tusciae]